MPQELMDAFIRQMIESLDGISEALRLLQQYCQTDIADRNSTDSDKTDISAEYLREILAQKSREGKADRIREILTLFHADRISDVEPANYSKLLEMVNVL